LLRAKNIRRQALVAVNSRLALTHPRFAGHRCLTAILQRRGNVFLHLATRCRSPLPRSNHARFCEPISGWNRLQKPFTADTQRYAEAAQRRREVSEERQRYAEAAQRHLRLKVKEKVTGRPRFCTGIAEDFHSNQGTGAAHAACLAWALFCRSSRTTDARSNRAGLLCFSDSM